MMQRLLRSRANWALLSAAGVVLAVACGESAKGGRSGDSGTDAGEPGAGQAGDSGSAGRGGAAGTGTGGRGDGGEPNGGSVSGAGRSGGPMAGQGGTSAAGAGASAGGATAGMGGINVVTPDGCTLDSHLLGGLYCSMAMTCDGETVLISCQEDGGDWRCGCVNGDERSDFYYFPDLTGLRTCEVSATACLNPELLDADEVCTLTDDAASSFSCTATDTCVRSHRIEGVILETRSSWSASCEGCTTSSDACCKCKEGHTPDYRLVSSDIADGCLYLDELCRRNEDVTLGAGSCETLEESTNDVSCSSNMRCEYPLRLADGTTLIVPKTLQTGCNTYGYPEPETQCRCIDDDGWDTLNLRFATVDVPDITMCRTSIQACGGVAALEPTGDVACTESGYPPSDGFCRLRRGCLQPATVLGTAVDILTGALVDCHEQDDGSWVCNCHDAPRGEERVTIELDVITAESACSQAVGECPLVSTGVFY